jgi:t-SNARE complex subunit (syntaxin)
VKYCPEWLLLPGFDSLAGREEPLTGHKEEMMLKRWFCILAMMLIPLAFAGGFYVGVKEGFEANNLSTQKRLVRLEQKNNLLEAKAQAQDDSQEVFVSSLADVHRTLSNYEGATNDLRAELLAWERQVLRRSESSRR